jgi:prepilin-type N-terminal cleavage/methylation domain-containing protein
MRIVGTTKRNAFTLIELLVVMGIIILIAVLGYFLLPPLSGDANRVRTFDALSEYLLTAKMRAKRDGLPTGIRLVSGTNGLPATQANQVVYVQQPDPLTSGSTGGACTWVSATSVSFTNVDFVGAATGTTGLDPLAPVQIGDYLELNGGGQIHQITAVTANQGALTATLTLASTVPVFAAGSTWRIVRQPRLLPGEDVKQLPGDYVIELATTAYTPPLSLVPPYSSIQTRQIGTGIPPNGATFYDIIFSPTGAVVGTGTTGLGKIILYVRDTAVATTTGPPGLVAINIRTGFIGVYDVNAPTSTTADHYLYTEDGRSSGL